MVITAKTFLEHFLRPTPKPLMAVMLLHLLSSRGLDLPHVSLRISVPVSELLLTE